MQTDVLNPESGATPDTQGRPITPSRLRRAMNLNIAVGAMGMAWYAVCSAQQIMQVFFKNHLGASDSELGLLVAVGQFAAPFHLVAIAIYGRLQKRKTFWVIATVIHRLLGYVLAAVAIWAERGGNTHLGVRIIIIASAVSWVLTMVSAAGWWSWIADLVPENVRGSFFGRRSAIIHAVNMVWFFSIQLCLDYLKEASTLDVYAVVFAVGGTIGILDILLHGMIPEPKRHPGETRIGWREFLEPVRNWNFLKFSVAIGLFTFSTSVFGPFVAPYITADVAKGGIGAPNTWLGIMFVISQTIWIATVTAWGLIMDRFGTKPAVILGALFPLTWVWYLFLTPSNYMYILPIAALLGGLLGPGYWNGVGQLMLTLTPQRNRTAFVAWHSAVVGVIAAGGSILGGTLKDAVASFHAFLWGIPVTSFHIVALVCFALCVPSIILLGRLRKGRERPVGFVVSRLATPGVFRTFLNLSTITSAAGSARTARAMRTFDGASSHLAVSDIISRLDDPDRDVREEAVRALGHIGSADAVDALLERLRDPNSTIRPEAAQALGMIGDPRAVPALTECAASPLPEVREACTRALEVIRRPRSPMRIIRELRAIDGPSSDETMSDVIGYLENPDPEVREEAARALGRIGLTEAVTALVRALRDPQSSIRPEAARALGQIGDPRAVPALIEGLASASTEVQDACAHALGAIGGREPVRHLRRLLDGAHPERVLASGAEAVSKHGILEAAWEILPLMHSSANPVLRGQLAIALGNLLGEPGQFYQYLTSETARQGSRLGRLFRGAKRMLQTFRPALSDEMRRADVLDSLDAELDRARGLMEGQSYRAAIDAFYEVARQLTRIAVPKEFPDEVAFEYAFARDVKLGVGFWFTREVKHLAAKTSDPELLHTDALLALYFLSTYRLPPEPWPQEAR